VLEDHLCGLVLNVSSKDPARDFHFLLSYAIHTGNRQSMVTYMSNSHSSRDLAWLSRRWCWNSLEWADFVRDCGSKHHDALTTSCWIISMVPKNQHSLGTLTGDCMGTQIRRGEGYRGSRLVRPERFPVQTGTDREGGWMHDVQEKDLRYPW